MEPDRFQRIEALYHAALARDPEGRAAFLAEACGDDSALRREVESLLAHEDEAKHFLSTPALEVAARLIEDRGSHAVVGRTIAHYRVLEKLGQGGMGVVYKARDTHLDRLVALKLLPPEHTADPERKRRFVQEAKAASALNHPHIVTVHDVATADGVDFIVMECVSGRTLGQTIGRKGLKLPDVLRSGTQIASALAAAHEAGIVHRDLKPGNVMITDRGLVKVLDFGLAKLTEPVSAVGTAMTGQPETQIGTIVGTAAYMSPEQAEGKAVDARSDIFSFGSVLYEMTTGRPAFSGATNLVDAVGDSARGAAAARGRSPGAGEDHRALPAQGSRCRIQHMVDVKLALEDLKEESDSGKLPPASLGAGARSGRGRSRRWRWPSWRPRPSRHGCSGSRSR